MSVRMADLSDPRALIAVGGSDRHAFLQNLVTNDVAGLDGGLVYAALLTPQGKYLADFFVHARDDAIWLDTAAPAAAALVRRLGMYCLRAAVTVAPLDAGVRRVAAGTEGALPDPRHPDLPWRLYGDGADDTDPTETRVRHVIPLTGVELVPDETYILEAGFERLSGVDFRKGCYVGQEVTARMKHKTELRKGLAAVTVEGAAPPGTPILAGDRSVGTLYSQFGGRGIAHLRFDRAAGEMTAGDARVHR